MEPSVETKTFHWADYVVFVGVLVISAAIGIYHAFAGGKQKSTKEFLMADQNMASLPVALSVLASFFSASTLLGTPAEIYQHGTQYWICVFGAIMAPITGAFLFGPLFFRLKLVSVFQYLEMRYGSKSVRLYGAAVFIIRTTIGMGIVLYGPSTALNSVTPLPTWSVIILIGVVCTFYTTLGGLKAVIWTDVFQTMVMFAGMLAVLIKGCIILGGVERVWEIAYNGDRIEFFNFDLDPHVRHTFWSLIIGIYFVWLPPYTVDQQMVQRFSSARSLRQAKLALLLNVPGMFLLISLCCLTGVVMFSYYAEGCDPLTGSKRAGNPNQLLPVFVMDLLHEYPGLPGLFVACLFSGALSSISSMMNSLSAVTWEDFLKLKFSNVSDERATLVTKFLAVLYGCLGVGMAFVVERLGGTVLQASLTLNGAAGAPLVGLFILGACFTSANWIGALASGVLGFVFSLWMSIGAYISKPVKLHDTPISLKNCPMSNTSTESNSTTVHPWTDLTSTSLTTLASGTSSHDMEGLDKLYGLSYIWFSVLGILIVVLIGLVVSLLSDIFRAEKHPVDPDLQLNVLKRLFHCFCRKRGESENEHHVVGSLSLRYLYNYFVIYKFSFIIICVTGARLLKYIIPDIGYIRDSGMNRKLDEIGLCFI